MKTRTRVRAHTLIHTHKNVYMLLCVYKYIYTYVYICMRDRSSKNGVRDQFSQVLISQYPFYTLRGAGDPGSWLRSPRNR